MGKSNKRKHRTEMEEEGSEDTTASSYHILPDLRSYSQSDNDMKINPCSLCDLNIHRTYNCEHYWFHMACFYMACLTSYTYCPICDKCIDYIENKPQYVNMCVSIINREIVIKLGNLKGIRRTDKAIEILLKNPMLEELCQQYPIHFEIKRLTMNNLYNLKESF